MFMEVFIMIYFLIKKEQVVKSGIQCGKKEQPFMVALDCLAQKVTQQHYRKKLDITKNYIALYRFGRSDYIAFWYEEL